MTEKEDTGIRSDEEALGGTAKLGLANFLPGHHRVASSSIAMVGVQRLVRGGLFRRTSALLLPFGRKKFTLSTITV
jgi:hypothetical protein